MNTWKVILATLVIFATGVVTGGLLVKYASNLNTQPVAAAPAPQVSNGATNRPFQPAANPWQLQSRNLLRKMERELTLTEGQREHMEQIITNSQERTRFIWKPITPQMNREMARVRREMRDQLSPEQAARFDGFFKQRQGQGKRRPVSANGTGTNTVPEDLNSALTNLPVTNPVPTAPASPPPK